MPEPREEPVGLAVTRISRTLARAFDEALAAAGGSTSTWLVLLAAKGGGHRTQAELAAVVGVRGPTLTHHLDGMERAGLVTRERAPGDRRGQRVSLTAAGEELFLGLREAAVAFDRRLRRGVTDDEVAELRRVLAALAANVAD
ncbi:MarR family transcriptional regulator, transcriptional regulator for hemolysin [Geodermatophilus saharensis]|uniref:MarR family transcriptional regulator, transcriptional regulator for hemolysin n=1 Tax=Geodermatophilus saharensis TaxID=1137994 RepID=A0A239EAP8_9ACTN|nr:MarR family winged helix-turn-helix transcriptional regulator [Geodermatophilus saharensis]SNS41716.1 MarR family transcriptional regulator, transcriptional regulator for hemolysin [Geodermatophilus saharensis]